MSGASEAARSESAWEPTEAEELVRWRESLWYAAQDQRFYDIAYRRLLNLPPLNRWENIP